MLIRALNIREVTPGIYNVSTQSVPLTEEQALTLDKLFPHSAREIDNLLDRESLLAAIVPNKEAELLLKHEVTATVKKGK